MKNANYWKVDLKRGKGEEYYNVCATILYRGELVGEVRENNPHSNPNCRKEYFGYSLPPQYISALLFDTGKTSIRDAIEMLMANEVKRVSDAYSEILKLKDENGYRS